MTYTPNVPQTNQTIAQTTDPIRNNFTYIDTTMKVNHAWQGNQITTEAPGSHQIVSMPNQLADVVGALPAGIAAIQYCIGGNLFTWDGTNKNPLSGKAVLSGGAFNLTTTYQTVVTLPNDSIGFIYLIVPALAGEFYVGQFFSTAGTLYTPVQLSSLGASIGVLSQAAGLALQIKKAAGAPSPSTYKIIYWPI